jgi:uncharacterized protein YceK
MIALTTMLLGTASGCGTLLNMDGKDALILDSRPLEEMQKHDRPPFPFGGVVNDVAWLKGAKEPIGIIGCVMDLPLSFTGDIITLPWTVFHDVSLDQKRTNGGDGGLPYAKLGPPVDEPAAK